MLYHCMIKDVLTSTCQSFIILIKWWLDGEQVGAHQHPTRAQLWAGIMRIVVGTSVVPPAFVAVDSLVQTRFSFTSKHKIGPSPLILVRFEKERARQVGCCIFVSIAIGNYWIVTQCTPDLRCSSTPLLHKLQTTCPMPRPPRGRNLKKVKQGN